VCLDQGHHGLPVCVVPHGLHGGDKMVGCELSLPVEGVE
jgi:hypothetical protein